MKPGNPDYTNFSVRSFLAKPDIKVSDGEFLSGHSTLLVFISAQMWKI